jgi:hypothetical protein
MRLAGILIACGVVVAMLFPQLLIQLIEKVPWQKSRHPQVARASLLFALAAAAVVWGVAFGE